MNMSWDIAGLCHSPVAKQSPNKVVNPTQLYFNCTGLLIFNQGLAQGKTKKPEVKILGNCC